MFVRGAGARDADTQICAAFFVVSLLYGNRAQEDEEQRMYLL